MRAFKDMFDAISSLNYCEGQKHKELGTVENLLVFILKVISTTFDLGKVLKDTMQNLFALYVNSSCSEELKTNLNLQGLM